MHINIKQVIFLLGPFKHLYVDSAITYARYIYDNCGRLLVLFLRFVLCGYFDNF